MNNIIIGISFFIKNNIQICPRDKILKFEDMCVHLNEIKPVTGRRRTLKPCKFRLTTAKKSTIEEQSQRVLECKFEDSQPEIKHCSGVVTPQKQFETETELLVSSAIVTTTETNRVFVPVINFDTQPITIKINTPVAQFKVLNFKELQKLQHVSSDTIQLAKMRDESNYLAEINKLIEMPKAQQNEKPAPEYEKFRFPTPENCPDITCLTNWQKKVYDKISEYKEKEKINPIENKSDRDEFLQQFSWQDSILSETERKQVEQLFVENFDVLAKHSFDVGYKSELQIKSTPSHELPVYLQSLHTRDELRDELLTELALMHYLGLITTLSNSKYGSPIFAQRKESGKLRILIDLRRISHLLQNDYLNSKFPISNMQDAVNHFAGKKAIL